MSDESLIPMTSAMHGITGTQNVTRAVGERIEALRASTRVSRIMAWTFAVIPAGAVAAAFAADVFAGIVAVYLGLFFVPIGIGVHWHRRRAFREASRLDRAKDVAWISGKDGLVFFGDEGLFVEKRGGYKPYAVNDRRFTDVTVERGKLTLHGMDSLSGATYSLDLIVPSGWTDDDTTRVRQKLDRFR